jgi:hypothetical protein
MSYTKASFDFMDRRDSKEAKTLMDKAVLILNKLSYSSSMNDVKLFLAARQEYLEFLYGKDAIQLKIIRSLD